MWRDGLTNNKQLLLKRIRGSRKEEGQSFISSYCLLCLLDGLVLLLFDVVVNDTHTEEEGDRHNKDRGASSSSLYKSAYTVDRAVNH